MPLIQEIAVIKGERIEPGKLVWRRYRNPAKGITELFLDLNPHLRHGFKTSPFLPVGVAVTIPIDPDTLADRPRQIDQVRFWGVSKAEDPI